MINPINAALCIAFLLSATVHASTPTQSPPELIKRPPHHVIYDKDIVLSPYNVSKDGFYQFQSMRIRYTELSPTKQASCKTATTTRERSCTTVFLIPGYGLSRLSMLGIAKPLLKLGFRTILLDPPGQGGSSGNHVGFGPYEAKGIEKFISNYAKENAHATPIFVVGYSYGAVIAINLATSNIHLSGMIAIAPFADTSEAIERYYKRNIEGLTLDTTSQIHAASSYLGYDIEQHSPKYIAENIRTPSLFIVPEHDYLTPAKEIKRMCKKNKHISCKTINKSSHVSLILDSSAYMTEIAGPWLTTHTHSSHTASRAEP